MAIGGVVINFKAVTDAAVREVKNLTSSLNDTDNAAKDADTNHSKLGATLKTGLAAGAAAAGAALVGIGAAMIEFGQAAIADYQAAEKLTDILKTVPGITDDMIAKNSEWIDSMEIATGVADDDLRGAIGKLTLSTQDLTTAQELTALAADTAAGSGKNFETVVTALDKAVNGNTSALERQFPWLDKNKDGTLTLAEATKGLGDAYAGAAEKAQDRDPWERIQTIWGQIKEQLGQWIIPLIEEFGDWFKSPENKKAISDIITEIGDMSRGLGEDLLPQLKDFLTYVSSGKWKEALGGAADDFKTVWDAVVDLVGVLASLITTMKTVWGWMKKLDSWTAPSWDRNVNWSDWPWSKSTTSSTTGTATTYGATPRAYTGPVTINVNAAENPYETARILKRSLEGYDIGQGRKPWTPLAPAW